MIDLALVGVLVAIPFMAGALRGPGGFSPAQIKRQRAAAVFVIGGLYGSCLLATLADPGDRSFHLFLMFFPASPVPIVAIIEGVMRWPKQPSRSVPAGEQMPEPVSV